jgi:2-hydroxychromene-2-carboxylate isomerase
MAVIEYFYSAHSAFAYLGSACLMRIAEMAGQRIVHKPFDLHRAMIEGGAAPFRSRSRAHIAYFFGREIERWSEQRDAPTLGRVPTHHAKDFTLANCMLVAAIEAGHCADQLAHAMLEAHWRRDADLSDEHALAAIARTVQLEPEPLLEAALTPKVRERYQSNTQEAVQRSVFGSPTYFVDGDMFYGQDRLEMVERALRSPYRNAWIPRKHTPA